MFRVFSRYCRIILWRSHEKEKKYRCADFLAALTVVILVTSSMLLRGMDTQSISYSDVVGLFKNEQVKEFEIDEKNNMTILKQDNTIVSYKLRSLELYYLD